MPTEYKVHSLEDSSVDLHDTILTQRMESSQPCRVLVVDDDDLVRAADRGLYASKADGGNKATAASIADGRVASIKQ